MRVRGIVAAISLPIMLLVSPFVFASDSCSDGNIFRDLLRVR